MSDAIQTTAAQNGTLNPITGTIGKAIDTFLDRLAIGGADKIIGSQYPTGQESPEAVAARLQAQREAQAAMAFNWQPWLVGGGIALAAVVGLALVLPRKS